jgi:hypothetical protein
MPLPEIFLKWQSKARIDILNILKEKSAKEIKTQPAHLPVLATLGEEPFCINLATRGMGLLPKKEKLEKFTNSFRETINKYKSKPGNESLSERMKVAIQFYGDLENFNVKLLGGLEIFEGQTYKNLQKYPLASLLFTGEAPEFLSFQLNGILEFIQKGNQYYEFLIAARELFAFDSFHIPQIKYQYGYLFYTVEIKQKTPFTRKVD